MRKSQQAEAENFLQKAGANFLGLLLYQKSFMTFSDYYLKVRQASCAICAPLEAEDYVVQPVIDVSPPKWHLGHTTWFFETMILQPFFPGYQVFNEQYPYVFNSYYETLGARVLRTDRGNLSRPTVQDVYRYRQYVDEQMLSFLAQQQQQQDDATWKELFILGLNHEQQHQELLSSDIKYILGHNPLFPAYGPENIESHERSTNDGGFVKMPAGMYEIGYKGNEFCFDNELQPHQVYLDDYQIAANLVSNAEYLEFIQAGGYGDFRFWHSEGWDWVKTKNATSPLYWHLIHNEWHYYTLSGLEPLDKNRPVCHVNFYEATAFAAWKQMRLPTEAEWEAASGKFAWGNRWEWTNSAYLPYPGFKTAAGAAGEYNGKFMVSQMVLRGASIATPEGHSRPTYRNFFHPYLQWQFTGIRLAK